MTTWHALEPADRSFFDAATVRHSFPIRLDVAPERVWQSLTSERSVADWGLGIRSLRWTSPRPLGVGATREVVLPLSAMTLREEFFRWDEGRGYSFHVRAADRSLFTRFAEDYVVEPDAGGCVFTWTIALEPRPRARRLMTLLDPLNRRAFGQLPRAARRYFGANP